LKNLFLAGALCAFAMGFSQADETATKSAAPAPMAVPAGAYTLDKAHASLLLRVEHLGFSNFTARFTRFEVQLQFDPANPAAAQVNASIDPRSLDIDNAPAGFLDALRGTQWLDTEKFPQLTFRSTHVEATGLKTLRVTGDLTLHGLTHPVTLDVAYNGGYAGHPMDPHARIGFSAHGSFKRSDFGIAYGIPPAGTSMGVSDAVEVIIESEFNGPAWTGAPAAQH
jgi:polyisoprenoid-binding protein YceI